MTMPLMQMNCLEPEIQEVMPRPPQQLVQPVLGTIHILRKCQKMSKRSKKVQKGPKRSKKVQKGSAVRKYLWPLWDSRNCILFPNCSDRLQEKNVFAIFLRSLEQLLRVKGQNNFSNTYYFNLVQFKCIGTRIYVPIWSNNLDVVSWRNKFEKNFGSEKGYPWKAFLCDFKTQCNVCGRPGKARNSHSLVLWW